MSAAPGRVKSCQGKCSRSHFVGSSGSQPKVMVRKEKNCKKDDKISGQKKSCACLEMPINPLEVAPR